MNHSIFRLLVSIAALASATLAHSAGFPGAEYPTVDKRSLQVMATEMPVFPPLLIHQGVTEGLVRVLISVNGEGVLSDWLVVAYTHEDLAIEAVRVLEHWKFEPMLLRGQPVSCQSEIEIKFEVQGVVISQNPADHIQVLMKNRKEQLAYRPSRFRELDCIPKPVIADSPAYPPELEEQGIRGTVTVEFYIDESGTVRMPAVVSTDHMELGHLAVDAVRNWRFEAPTVNGRPVLTRVRQRFDFQHKPESLAQKG